MKTLSYILLCTCLLATACKKEKTVAGTHGTPPRTTAPDDTTTPTDPQPVIDPHVDSLLGTYYGTERFFLLFTKNGDTLNFIDSVYPTTITVSSVTGSPKSLLITKTYANNATETVYKHYVNTTHFQDGPPPPNSGGVAWYFYPEADSLYYWHGGISQGNGNARQETFTTGNWKK